MSRLKNIFDQQRQSVALGKLLGRGGEGAVFEIVGTPDLVAKIYHADKARERQKKIDAMVASDMQTRTPNAAFPISSLYEGSGIFAGFTMRRIGNQKPVHQLYSPASRRNEFPNATYPLLVRTTLNIAKAVAAVHAAGCVIGDLNHSGILVGKDATATLIDCDSFQFSKDGKTYLCEVGVPDYTPPELQGKSYSNVQRTQNHDAFGLGVAIFSLLFLGRHPFAGKYLGRGEMPEERAIAEYRFAYSSERSRTQTEPPPFAPTLSYIPKPLAAAFESCFGPTGSNGGRPRPADWISLLQNAETRLVKCGATDAHSYFSDAPNCPWCALEKAVPGSIAFPSPLFVNTATPINLGELIAAIRGVAAPDVAPALNSAMPTIQVKPNVNYKGTLDSTAGQYLLATFGGIAATSLLRLGYVPPLVGLGALAASAYFALRNPVTQHASAPRAHQLRQAWDQIDLRYRTDGDGSRFTELRRQSELRIREFTDLPNEESRRMTDLARRQRDIQLRYFLERFSLVNAKIRGIGNAKKSTLRSFNIHTAADLERRRIESISGFGPVTASQLLSWRSDLERRFVYQPNQPINPSDIAHVKSDIARRRTTIEAALKDDLIAIRTTSAEIERSRTDLTNRACTIWAELKQAEADEKARVFGDVTARRWVFGVACFATLMVSGLNTNARTTPTTPSTPAQNRTSSTTPAPLPSSNSNLSNNNSSNATVSAPPTVPAVRLSASSIPTPLILPSPSGPSIQDLQKNAVALPPTAPPLDPPRELGTQPTATEPSTGISRSPSEPATAAALIGRLTELGFARTSDAVWSSNALASLREFKIVNHLPPDSQLDPVTIRTLLSPQALARGQSFLGGWSVDPVCSQGSQLTISAREARTEAGICSFDTFIPVRSGWTAKGRCQVGTDRWPATINFTVLGKALTWSSAKGSSTYYRC